MIKPCEFCMVRPANQRHHRFPQTVAHREAYGKLIDCDFNIAPACSECNGSHANVELWSEERFRQEAISRGYTTLGPGTKSYQNKKRGGLECFEWTNTTKETQ
jgi:hypothetical protein